MSFVVESPEHEESFEREYPIVITADLLYNPWKDLVVFGGLGMEFDSNQNFFVHRIGIEYEVPIAGHWDFSPSLFYSGPSPSNRLTN